MLLAKQTEILDAERRQNGALLGKKQDEIELYKEKLDLDPPFSISNSHTTRLCCSSRAAIHETNEKEIRYKIEIPDITNRNPMAQSEEELVRHYAHADLTHVIADGRVREIDEERSCHGDTLRSSPGTTSSHPVRSVSRC